MSTSLLTSLPLKLSAAGDIGLIDLASNSGLHAQLLPSGALHAFRHEGTLISQFLPSPAEDGLFRLLLRWRSITGSGGWAPLVGPTTAFTPSGPSAAAWTTTPAPGLSCTTVVQLHPRQTAWTWRVTVRNDGTTHFAVDVLHAQDLGLADEEIGRAHV